MKKIVHLGFGFWFCSIFMLTLNAQTLEELLALAEAENLGLKVVENEYLAALEKVPQVGQWPDAELGLGVFPLPVETRLGAQVARIGATQMFPWFGLLKEERNLAQINAEVVKQDIRSRQLELQFQVKMAYFKLFEISKSVQILNRNLILLNALEQLALAEVESGKSILVEVLSVQIKKAEISNEILILERARAKPMYTINQLLNRALDTEITMEDSLTIEYPLMQKDDFLDSVNYNHPAFIKIDMQNEVALKKITLNKLNRKPSFGLGMDYIMVNERTDIEPTNNGRDILQLRGAIKVPLSMGKYEAKENEERYKIDALRQQKENLEKRFQAEIEKAYVDIETASLRVELYEQQKELNKAALNVLKSSYSSSGSKFDEILRLESELIQYDLKILKNIVKSHLAQSYIERFD